MKLTFFCRIEKTAHVKIQFDTYSNVVSFASDNLDIFKIAEAMKKKGWNLNNLQKPSCAHICVTAMHIGMGDAFLKDLADSVDEVLKNPGDFKVTKKFLGKRC